MKKYFLLYLITILSPCLLPLFALFAPAVSGESSSAPRSNTSILVYNEKTDKISEENLEEYLVGVVSAEMPASYEIEALKAQAVAARSYILSRKGKGNPDHPDADVCTNPAHCKAYISSAEAMENWGERGEEYLEKISLAVRETQDEYLSYNDEIVVACFYAVSSGKTENAKDVWGGDVPYLVSVDSSADLTYENLTEEASFSLSEAKELLGVESLSLGGTEKTEGGSVKTIKIGDKAFSGVEIRSLFGLNSANFEVSLSDSAITFVTTGKGHGVGMSQYGANMMAKDGKNYTEILLHYYSNVTIEKGTEI